MSGFVRAGIAMAALKLRPVDVQTLDSQGTKRRAVGAYLCMAEWVAEYYGAGLKLW